MVPWIHRFIRRYHDGFSHLIAFYENPSQTWSQMPAPEDKWQMIKEMTVWVLPSAIARCLGWGYWNFWAAIFKAFLWFLLIFALMVGIGKLIYILAIFFDSEIDEARSLQLSFFSFLPLLAMGILYVNPLLGVLVPIVSLFGLFILFTAVQVQFSALKNKIFLLILIGSAMVLGVWVTGMLTGGLFLPKY